MNGAFWDDVYERGSYGHAPNDTLVAHASKFPSGSRILSLGEGEGRNAIWLAKQGHRVHALDLSPRVIEKLNRLAAEAGVEDLIVAEVADLVSFDFASLGPWGGVISIWCHLPPQLRQLIHANAVASLLPGGVFIAEYYTPLNIGRGTGGPQAEDLCLTVPAAEAELAGLQQLSVVEAEREVAEGTLHNGMSSVLQIVGIK